MNFFKKFFKFVSRDEPPQSTMSSYVDVSLPCGTSSLSPQELLPKPTYSTLFHFIEQLPSAERRAFKARRAALVHYQSTHGTQTDCGSTRNPSPCDEELETEPQAVAPDVETVVEQRPWWKPPTPEPQPKLKRSKSGPFYKRKKVVYVQKSSKYELYKYRIKTKLRAKFKSAFIKTFGEYERPFYYEPVPRVEYESVSTYVENGTIYIYGKPPKDLPVDDCVTATETFPYEEDNEPFPNPATIVSSFIYPYEQPFPTVVSGPPSSQCSGVLTPVHYSFSSGYSEEETVVTFSHPTESTVESYYPPVVTNSHVTSSVYSDDDIVQPINVSPQIIDGANITSSSVYSDDVVLPSVQELPLTGAPNNSSSSFYSEDITISSSHFSIDTIAELDNLLHEIVCIENELQLSSPSEPLSELQSQFKESTLSEFNHQNKKADESFNLEDSVNIIDKPILENQGTGSYSPVPKNAPPFSENEGAKNLDEQNTTSDSTNIDQLKSSWLPFSLDYTRPISSSTTKDARDSGKIRKINFFKKFKTHKSISLNKLKKKGKERFKRFFCHHSSFKSLKSLSSSDPEDVSIDQNEINDDSVGYRLIQSPHPEMGEMKINHKEDIIKSPDLVPETSLPKILPQVPSFGKNSMVLEKNSRSKWKPVPLSESANIFLESPKSSKFTKDVKPGENLVLDAFIKTRGSQVLSVIPENSSNFDILKEYHGIESIPRDIRDSVFIPSLASENIPPSPSKSRFSDTPIEDLTLDYSTIKPLRILKKQPASRDEKSKLPIIPEISIPPLHFKRRSPNSNTNSIKAPNKNLKSDCSLKKPLTIAKEPSTPPKLNRNGLRALIFLPVTPFRPHKKRPRSESIVIHNATPIVPVELLSNSPNSSDSELPCQKKTKLFKKFSDLNPPKTFTKISDPSSCISQISRVDSLSILGQLNASDNHKQFVVDYPMIDQVLSFSKGNVILPKPILKPIIKSQHKVQDLNSNSEEVKISPSFNGYQKFISGDKSLDTHRMTGIRFIESLLESKSENRADNHRKKRDLKSRYRMKKYMIRSFLREHLNSEKLLPDFFVIKEADDGIIELNYKNFPFRAKYKVKTLIHKHLLDRYPSRFETAFKRQLKDNWKRTKINARLLAVRAKIEFEYQFPELVEYWADFEEPEWWYQLKDFFRRFKSVKSSFSASGGCYVDNYESRVRKNFEEKVYEFLLVNEDILEELTNIFLRQDAGKRRELRSMGLSINSEYAKVCFDIAELTPREVARRFSYLFNARDIDPSYIQFRRDLDVLAEKRLSGKYNLVDQLYNRGLPLPLRGQQVRRRNWSQNQYSDEDFRKWNTHEKEMTVKPCIHGLSNCPGVCAFTTTGNINLKTGSCILEPTQSNTHLATQGDISSNDSVPKTTKISNLTSNLSDIGNSMNVDEFSILNTKPTLVTTVGPTVVERTCPHKSDLSSNPPVSQNKSQIDTCHKDPGLEEDKPPRNESSMINETFEQNHERTLEAVDENPTVINSTNDIPSSTKGNVDEPQQTLHDYKSVQQSLKPVEIETTTQRPQKRPSSSTMNFDDLVRFFDK